MSNCVSACRCTARRAVNGSRQKPTRQIPVPVSLLTLPQVPTVQTTISLNACAKNANKNEALMKTLELFLIVALAAMQSLLAAESPAEGPGADASAPPVTTNAPGIGEQTATPAPPADL